MIDHFHGDLLAIEAAADPRLRSLGWQPLGHISVTVRQDTNDVKIDPPIG
jgi:hypothetical protein